MHRCLSLRAAGSFAVLTLMMGSAASAGPLVPPVGPVSPTPGPEPRIAINAANTPGDNDATPSLFKITQPGSYYLAGNVTGVAGKHGIEIAADGVTIDLNGFELFGGGAGSGSLDGVKITGAPVSNARVMNGSLRGWGGNGVDLFTITSNGGAVIGVAVSQSGLMGIRTGDRMVIEGCTSFQNGATGIQSGYACTLTNCTVTLNGGTGISSSANSIITQCAIVDNGSSGISSSSGMTIRDCVVTSNNGDGIRVSEGSSVINNLVSDSDANGIRVSTAPATLIGNQCRNNGRVDTSGAGIRIEANGADARLEGNTCVGNRIGYSVVGAGHILLRNFASGNTVFNWSITAGNIFVVVQAPATASLFQGNAGGGGYGTTDPNANITY